MATVTGADAKFLGVTEGKKADRPGFLKRLFHAMIESRKRAAEREVGRFMTQHGYKFPPLADRNPHSKH